MTLPVRGIDNDGDSVPDCRDACLNTVPGASVDANGCPPIIPGDYDPDSDVDLVDLAAFGACSSGPAIPLAVGCEGKDFDHDGDSDQTDFGTLQRCYSGNKPADPNCAN